jgi:hypothetical protein
MKELLVFALTQKVFTIRDVHGLIERAALKGAQAAYRTVIIG